MYGRKMREVSTCSDVGLLAGDDVEVLLVGAVYGEAELAHLPRSQISATWEAYRSVTGVALEPDRWRSACPRSGISDSRSPVPSPICPLRSFLQEIGEGSSERGKRLGSLRI
jgi:hypothetical protein